MDGQFVPNLTFGPLIVASLHPMAQAVGVPLDVHLMVEKPENLIPACAQPEAGFLTVHVETCPHCIAPSSRSRSWRQGRGNPQPGYPALHPGRDLPDVDWCWSCRHPGFGGQSISRQYRSHCPPAPYAERARSKPRRAGREWGINASTSPRSPWLGQRYSYRLGNYNQNCQRCRECGYAEKRAWVSIDRDFNSTGIAIWNKLIYMRS